MSSSSSGSSESEDHGEASVLELLFPTVKDSYGKGNYTTLVTLGGMLELVARDGRVVQFIERMVGGAAMAQPMAQAQSHHADQQGGGVERKEPPSHNHRTRGGSSSSSMHGIRTTGGAM